MQDTADLKIRIKELMVENLMLQMPAEEIADDQLLFGPDSLGLDSVDALQLVVALDKNFGIKLPNPEAARQVLVSLGLWERLAGSLVRGENIAQAYQFVASGNADLGFVARAQLQGTAERVDGSSWEPPLSSYDPIEQQAVLVRDSTAGRQFMAFMRGPEMRALIRAHGYDVPDVQ